MKRTTLTACRFTLITAVLFGLVYPFVVTVLAQAIFPSQAGGELIFKDGRIIGSRLLGQPFTGSKYFHSRPSEAGTGYDAAASSGSNLAPTSKALLDRVTASVQSEQASGPVPVDLVTASGSGLDPDITPAAALYQIPRIARVRHMSEPELQRLVTAHTLDRQFAFLGEPRVNVLELNLELDAAGNNH